MHHAAPHIHALLVRYFHSKEMDELYLSVFLKSLAESFISIFVPIYLYTLGYPLKDIALYHLIFFTMVAIAMPTSMRLNARLGIKKTMAVGTACYIIFYLLLNHVAAGLPYAYAALAHGVSVALYFSAFHLEFTRSAVKKEEGEEVSMLQVIAVLSVIIGPLVGSLFIDKVSFSAVFFIASAVLLCSVIPLFLTKDFTLHRQKVSVKKAIKADSGRKAIAYQASAVISIVSSVFWPLFIYITLGEVVSLGVIVSLTSVLMIFILFLTGRCADKDEKGVLRFGVFSHAPFWLLRLFFLSPFGLFFSNFFSSATNAAIDISFGKLIYEKAEKCKDRVHYFLFREFNLEIGRILILVLAVVTQSLTWMFVAAFFATFAHLVLVKEK